MKAKLKILFALLLLFSVSCDKDVFTGLIETEELELNMFYVSSTPKGLNIFIDDKNMGVVTPDTVKWLKKGAHKLTLKGELYLRDTSMTINVKEKILDQVDIDLTRNPNFYGKIACSSQPSSAKIYINDVFTGFITPNTITNLIPGEYKITYKKDLCREDSTRMLVKGGEVRDFFSRLEDTTRTVSYRMSNSKIISNSLTKIVIDKNNNKWIGSFNTGLFTFDGTISIKYDNFGKLSDAKITDLMIDRTGKLWIASSTSLTVFDGISWYEYSNQLPSNIVTCLAEDLNGNIWIGTYNGLVKYYNSTFEVYNKQNAPLPENNIQCITTLSDGSIAIGFSISGIMIKKESSWIEHNIGQIFAEDKIANFVTAIIEDNNKIIWTYVLGDPTQGTRSALLRYENGLWKKFELPLQFPVEVVSFYQDSNNNLWLACKEGLVKYNPSQGAKIFNNVDYNFFAKHCTSVYVDKNGDVWVTILGGGLVKMKKGYY